MDPASPDIGGPVIEHNINFPGFQLLPQGLQRRETTATEIQKWLRMEPFIQPAVECPPRPNPVPWTGDTTIAKITRLFSWTLQSTSEFAGKDVTEISALPPTPKTSFLNK